MEAISRSALGVSVTLGALYDARRDNFLATSIFDIPPQDENATVSWQKEKVLRICDSNTPAAKFKAVDLFGPLAASCLAGWVEYEGSGQFLAPVEKAGDDEIYQALHFMTTTVKHELDLANTDFSQIRVPDTQATHIVTQILYGACCTAVASGSVPNATDRTEISRKFADATNILYQSTHRDVGLATLAAVADGVFDSSLSITCYSDISSVGDRQVMSRRQAKDHLEDVFELAYNDAQPVSYILTPISDIIQVRVKNNRIGQLETSQLETILAMTNDFSTARISLDKHHKRLRRNQSFIRPSVLVDSHNAQEDIRAAENKFKTKFSALLESVRAKAAEYQDVKAFIGDFSMGPLSPKHYLSLTTQSSGKLDLVETLTTRGARCVTHEDHAQYMHEARYVFFFSEAAMRHDSWTQNMDLVMQLLGNHDSGSAFIAIDCDMGGPHLVTARVSELRNGELKVDNMIEQHDHESSLCFIRFDVSAVDSTVKDQPAQHKSVTIPCPGQSCDGARRDWVCQKCRVRVEFGVVDSFFYCDCGRAPLSSAGFDCQQHGQSFARYDSRTLQGLLKNLPTPPEINVLILGETGVGKSTFINSLINYLSFDTLDEALANKDLNYIIPCSFSTQSEGAGGRLVQSEVRIGNDKDEHDGSKGASATQDSSAYSVYYGGGMIRLIDTPGIGDTRGKNQDEQNLMKILRVLRNYEKLHGILVLLKPNNARLTIMFKYCIKELLTQLHKSAAQNIVFGFTNTRGSNYQPGDTFKPLETLLKEHEDVLPGLFKDTVYCFDSESFRYLAAHHKGVDMGNIEDYRRSWDHSASEARRLADYLQRRTPHEVKNTVSLNETRHLIAQLIQPMARIINAITATVQDSEQKIRDLHDTNLRGKQLESKLTMTKTIVDSKQLSQPKTVCSNSSCCQYIPDSSQDGNSVTLFKSKCHDPCCLVNVPPDVIGAQELPQCAAFAGYDECRRCGHHWREHQHIMIEYSERTETSTDPTVQNALNHNVDDAKKKKVQIEALQRLMKELEDEHQMMQLSQARFSHYLQQHSITHYNDATIEYYEHLIKDEKTKVSQGAQRKRLEQMEKDQASYQAFVNAMKTGKGNARAAALDEQGVANLVSQLYAMKHYGKNLRDCAKKTGEAYASTYRERSYRVRKGAGGGSAHSSNWDRRESTRFSGARSGLKDFSNDLSNAARTLIPSWPAMGGKSTNPYDRPDQRAREPYASRDERVQGPYASRDESSDGYSSVTDWQSSYGNGKQIVPATRSVYGNNNDFRGHHKDDDDEDRKHFMPVRAMEVQQPPTQGGVKNWLLDDNPGDSSNEWNSKQGDPFAHQGRKSGMMPRVFSDGLQGYGSPVSVMHGLPLQRSKSHWFSSVKNKLKSKRGLNDS